ncbi:MAG: AAA family ATPase [Magnetococcales bacterium]|nr:AAA family ATPase [Magnetococcales bacterium]
MPGCRITRLTLRNFKSIGEQTYEFGSFDLLVGRNNAGKSTILQALAIWQFCIDQFRQARRGGERGIQVVLPNFTALPVPEFNLLWKDKTDRHYVENLDHPDKKQLKYILIHIGVEWKTDGTADHFGITLRYHSPQTIYAIPEEGWQKLQGTALTNLPTIAYIPPFSGLEPVEKRLDPAPIRQQVGKGQPGSVLRNLLLTVPPEQWSLLAERIEQWFSVTLRRPVYDPQKDVHIQVLYQQDKRLFDLIAGGSGFQQTLILLAFLYGYRPDVMLIDEPDAHLHGNLQREILDFFLAQAKDTQFLIATHAEEMIRGVNPGQILSLLDGQPRRVGSSAALIRALSDVNNQEIYRLQHASLLLYVEGDSDERLLRAWAEACDATAFMGRILFRSMGGGNKKEMAKRANEHFEAAKEIRPDAMRLILFDYDRPEDLHFGSDNAVIHEWQRKNIENYLLVSATWKKLCTHKAGPLFAAPFCSVIDIFFAEQNLTLPSGKVWRSVNANIFQVVDGKRLLFEEEDSLSHRLAQVDPSMLITREEVARHMSAEEIHQDVHTFFARVIDMLASKQ